MWVRRREVIFREVRIITALAALVCVGGCKREKPPPPPVPKTKPAPATPIDTKRAELGGPMWNPSWDRIVEDALPPSMLSSRVSRDVQGFCPSWNQMSELNKRAFWAYFFQALAGAEAGLKPTAQARHTQPQVAVIDGVTGRSVRSQGLLQLTYEDARRYGCDFDWRRDRPLSADDPAKTILRPKNNLECGVRILERQIIDQHKPLVCGTAYWSTLRPGTVSYRVFRKQMTNVPLACRTNRRIEMAHR